MSRSPLTWRYAKWNRSAVLPTSPDPFTVNVPFPLAYCVDPATAGAPISAAVQPPGSPSVTVTVRAAEVVVVPSSSRATAVTEYVPAGTLLQLTLYGLLVSVPINVAPA